ncbi:MAG: hypothetical protein OEY28_10820, partial [Nitrospira sp.]|nr:hypothetical protein [Nitrospira sp.]
TNELSILDGAAIDTSTFSSAHAGNIEITATNIHVSGANNTNGVTSPSSTISSKATWDRQADNPTQEQQNTGNAGNINIETVSLDIRDGGQLTASTETAGNAGNIDVVADNIVINGRQGVTRSGITSRSEFSGSPGGNGGNVLLSATTLSVTAGGAIELGTRGGGSGGHLVVNAGQIAIASGGIISSTSSSNGTGGNLALSAQTFTMTDVGSEISVRTTGPGNGGTITLNAANALLGPGGIIDSRTSGTFTRLDPTMQATGGDITVNATNTLTLNGAQIDASSAGLTSNLPAIGDAGSISVSAGHIQLANGAGINTGTTLSTGAGGTIMVTGTGPTGSVLLSGASSIKSSTTGTGNAGNIIVAGNTVTVSETDSTIDSSTSNVGNAGTIQVSASQVVLSGGGTISSSTRSAGAGGTVSVAGTGPTGSVLLSGGSITAATTGSGNAGNISVSGNTVTLSGTASSIDSSTTGSGNAGNIHIQAGQVNLENGSTISSASVAPATGNAGSVTVSTSGQFQNTGGTVTTSADSGQGGDITIQSNDILLNSGATVTARSTGPQDAGNILLVARDRIMLHDSTVTTEASQASGGNITLQAPNLIRLRSGQIISSVQGSTGTVGGDITIDPQAVLLQNNSQILAQAFEGNGGNISITAGVLIVEPGSLIDATSQLGVSGQVSLQAPIQSLAGIINPLPQSFVNNATLYAQHCAVNKGGQFSSFVQGSRDGVPPQPGDYLGSPLALDLASQEPARPQSRIGANFLATPMGHPAIPIHGGIALRTVSGCKS